MSDRRPAPALVVAAPEDEPLVLSGPPGELTGEVRLHNPGERKVVLRDAGINDPSGVLRLPSARHPLDPVVLRPDEADSVPLAIAVDPATPPGDYEVELEVGGRSRKAVLHVEEVFDLDVEPGTLVVANRKGVPQAKRISVTNEGNVAFTLDDPGVVDLRDDMPRDRDVLRVAIEPLLDRDRTDLDALVVALLAAAREEGDRIGCVDVRVRGGKVALQPGETKVVELEITLQDELPPKRRYRGHIPVQTRDVDVVVVATGGPPVAETTPPPTGPPPSKPPPSKPPRKNDGEKKNDDDKPKPPRGRAPRRGGNAS